MTACKTLLLVFLFAKSQERSVSQLARHVDLFHLVNTDNQRRGTVSLPHRMAPLIKPPTHYIQAAVLWSWGRHPSSLYLTFFSTRGVVVIWQFLTSGAKPRDRLTGCSGWGWPLGFHILPSPVPRLLNWPHVPMDCGSRTLLLCPLSHPPLASLSLPFTWPTPLLRLGKCHPSQGCLLSQGHRSHSAAPGTAPTPAGAPLCLA
jgi:hypothetical protein